MNENTNCKYYDRTGTELTDGDIIINVNSPKDEMIVGNYNGELKAVNLKYARSYIFGSDDMLESINIEKVGRLLTI